MSDVLNHLFVTQDYGPDRGGMARRHVELCRRFGDAINTMQVSTVSSNESQLFDMEERYSIHRQPFPFREANRFANQVKWAGWLTTFSRNSIDVIHCGNIRPVGYAVAWAHRRLGVPYLVYVNGGDLLREQRKISESKLKRRTARRILGNASGIVATSQWVADLARDVADDAGVNVIPPIAALDLGTNPDGFSASRHTGALRERWRIGHAPVALTVARLVPHKGQELGIRAIAALSAEFPSLRYVLVGEGHDEARLRSIAEDLGVAERVIFAGALSEDELPEAYATSNIYLGASRLDNTINVEGFGISFLEASASGLPVVAGDSGGVRSAVRDGVTGIVVEPVDVSAISGALAQFLRDPARSAAFGAAGRRAVEEHFNWDRVARDTRAFTLSVIGNNAEAR